MKESRLVSQLTTEMKAVKELKQEYREMLMSLEEGIIVVQDKAITFTNDIFKDILKGIAFQKGQGQSTPILNLKLFKVF